MQMQIQIKTECSFAVKIYKSRQVQAAAQEGKRTAALEEKKKNQSAKYPTERAAGAQMHLLDTFACSIPAHRPSIVNAATLI